MSNKLYRLRPDCLGATGMFAYRMLEPGKGKTKKARCTDIVYRKREIDPDELFTRYELELHSIPADAMRGEWYSEFRTGEDMEAVTEEKIITRHTRYPYIFPDEYVIGGGGIC